MSRENQIGEMAKVIGESLLSVLGVRLNDDILVRLAEHPYNAGYRKQEWISVDERLPEVGESVLGYAESIDECFVVAYSNTYRTFFCGQFPNDDISHWMPLPEAPKMKGGG